jgi:hypothetical protein
MKELPIYEDYEAVVADWEGTPPLPEHVDRTIDSDTTVVIARDGTVPAIFLSQRIDLALLKSARRDWWKAANKPPKMRALACGAPLLPEITNGGKPSAYNSVPKPVLERLGKTGSLTYQKHRELLDRHKGLIRLINRLYREHDEERYERQRAEVKKNPDSRVRHTSFNRVYLSKKWATKYHPDGNWPGGMTALVATGDFEGGALVLPRWRIAFALKVGDVLLFDAEQLHGNLPISGKRLSAAFYCASRGLI